MAETTAQTTADTPETDDADVLDTIGAMPDLSEPEAAAETPAEPAATEPATPEAAEPEQPEDETAAPEGGTPPETPAAPAAQEKEKPAAPAQQPPAKQPADPDPDLTALDEIRQQKQALLDQLAAADAEDFDVIDHGPAVMKAQAKLIRLQEQERQAEGRIQQRQQQAKAYEDFWAARPADHRKACEDVYQRVLKETGDPNAALMEANVELRVLERTAAKPATPAPAAAKPKPVAAKPAVGTRITPTGGTRTPPPPKSLSVMDQISAGRFGKIDLDD